MKPTHLNLTICIVLLGLGPACQPVPEEEVTPSPDCPLLLQTQRLPLRHAIVAEDPCATPTAPAEPTATPSTDLDGDSVPAAQDCNDESPTVFPGAPELCDGLDNDCDPATPSDDADQDGSRCDEGDCDDSDASRYPGAREVCGDDVPNDCNATSEDQSCLTPQLSIAQAHTILIGPENEDAAGHRLLTARLTGCAPNAPLSLVVPAERAGAGVVYVLPLPLPPGEFPLAGLSSTQLYGEVPDSWTGNQLAAGDLNGDGCEDLVISSPYDSALNAGRVTVVYGPLPEGPVSLATCEHCVTLAAETAGGYFGNSLVITDLNGDGLSDLVVSAWHDRAGKVYLYAGRTARLTPTADAESQADASWEGESRDDEFGFRLTAPGDLNQDGLPELVITAPGHVDGTGAAYVLLGDTVLPAGNHMGTELPIKLVGENPGDQFGNGLSDVGDATGDGKPELVVGASDHSSTSPLTGRAYLFAGPWSADGAPHEAQTHAQWIWSGTEGGQELGFNLGNVGDLNGDGLAEVAIGLPYLNVTTADNVLGLAGQTELVLGVRWDSAQPLAQSQQQTQPPSTLPSLRLLGDRTEGWSGYSVLGTPDLTGDGRRDFLIGAPSASGAASEPGRVYVLQGETPD